MDVFVLNMRNESLMPCSPAKARILLKEGKAVVVRKTPFTIKLTIATGENKQPVAIGVDPGYKHLGICISSEKRVYYVSEIVLRTDISKLLATRKELRRSRRYRKTRYRKPTGIFNFSPYGWLPPSIRHKINTTVFQIEKLSKLIPISKIVVEVAKFDIQKIKNPDIKGIEYQKGEQLNFWNVREYVLYRDNHQCQYCRGKSCDKVLNVHHIESRKTGGDAPNNLITLCKTCHKKYHNKEINLKIKRGHSFKAETFMTSVRWKIIDQLKERFHNIEIKTTYGYITKNNRISLNLKKEHYVDAFCIAGNLNAKLTDKYYYQVQKRCHNRQIHKVNFNKKGIRPRNQLSYEFLGFRLFDKIRTNDGRIGFIFAKRSNGYFDVRDLNHNVISAGINCKKLTLIEKRKSILTKTKNNAFPSLPEGKGIHAEDI